VVFVRQGLLKLPRLRKGPQVEEARSPISLPQKRPELPAQLLRRLEFKVLRRLDGYLFGNYSGLFYGPSLDLAEVREYQPGDEVRRIDWHVTARTGTLHVRQYREEREIIAWLIVDMSASMSFGTRRALKREVALEFAGVAAAIITRQGNKIGALAFSPKGSKLTPLGSGRNQALAIMQSLQAQSLPEVSRFHDQPELAFALAHANRTLRRRALVFVVSDFITSITSDGAFRPDAEPAWGEELTRLAHKHDVVAVRITDPAERELPVAGELRLRDPETGQEVWLDTADPRVRRAHARLVAQREQVISRTLKAARADLLELSTERDLVEPIVRFTRRRRGRRA
jgi:uncharacterized protein (DUF58 family)